jgi:hypothetical protein
MKNTSPEKQGPLILAAAAAAAYLPPRRRRAARSRGRLRFFLLSLSRPSLRNTYTNRKKRRILYTLTQTNDSYARAADGRT